MGRPPVGVEVEDHSLALADHAQHRSDQGVGGEVVVGEVGIAGDHAVATDRVVGLDHALQGGARQPAVEAGALGALTTLATLPDLRHPVHTFSRLGVPSTRARTRWMFGFQRRLVRRCECDTDMPHEGFLPHTSQTEAIA